MSESSAVAEEWRDLPGFEGYYKVSNTGLVASVDRMVGGTNGSTKKIRGCMIRPSNSKDSHSVHLCIYRDGENKTYSVGQLVLLAFVSPPPAPESLAIHWNGDASDNRPENLFWGTKSDLSLLQEERNADRRRAKASEGAP